MAIVDSVLINPLEAKILSLNDLEEVEIDAPGAILLFSIVVSS